MRIPILCTALAIGAVVSLNAATTLASQASLAGALAFHAPFDGGVDARRAEAQPGLPPTDTVHAAGAGRFGDAIRFTRRGAPAVFYQGGANMPYAASNWTGTVSFWLSTDPQTDLGIGFCDPIQITPRMWNNGAFFVEFEKSKVAGADVPFRLGV